MTSHTYTVLNYHFATPAFNKGLAVMRAWKSYLENKDAYPDARLFRVYLDEELIYENPLPPVHESYSPLSGAAHVAASPHSG